MAMISADELKKSYRLTKITGIAIIGSTFIYLLVAEFIRRENAPFEGFAPFPEIAILRYALLGAAIAEFFLIGHISRLILSLRTPIKKEAPQECSCPREIRTLMTEAVISFALCESVAIYGFILFLLAGSFTDLYTFMVLSLLYFWKYFPRYSRWEEWIKAVQR
jgi:F0F1-type ATP synthase membrane subunit c/vacuolar-type H+-ATPase subunit K